MFNFPFTTFHELNLDWILSVVKTAQSIFETGRADIDYAVETADEAKTIATQAAEATIADNSISTAKLQAGAVTHVKLADDAVEGNNIKNGEVTNVKIADNSISTDKLQTGAVTHVKLADDAVEGNNIKNGEITNAKIADDAITNVKIADGTITPAKLNTSSHYESLTSIITADVFSGTRTVDTIHKIAFVSLSVESETNIATNTPITKVPDYYPQYNYGMPALLVLADGTFRMGLVIIQPDGNIVQKFSSSVRKIYLSGYYPFS